MRLIKLKEVMHSTGMSRSTIYKYIAAEVFPKPVSLGERSVAWVEDEIQRWINIKIEQRLN
jgi:prophage regulatory protein